MKINKYTGLPGYPLDNGRRQLAKDLGELPPKGRPASQETTEVAQEKGHKTSLPLSSSGEVNIYLVAIFLRFKRPKKDILDELV